MTSTGTTTETPDGSTERATFHNPDSGSAVLRVKTRKLHFGRSLCRRLAISAGLQASPEAHRLIRKRAGCEGRAVLHWDISDEM